MEYVRIAILDTNNSLLGFLDNAGRDALHYWDDTLHTYLKGSASTFTFKSEAKHENSQFLAVGNKLAFQYKEKSYYFNIVTAIQNEDTIEVMAFAMCFELLNEHARAYKAESAMTFVQYFNIFIPDQTTIKIELNEVSSKKIKNEWTGNNDTELARLYSLASLFGAELEFIPVLNDDYTLNHLELNVYQQHSATVQGIGENRSDVRLRYGVNVETVKKTSDISELYTAIMATGKDGITIASQVINIYDDDGNLLYTSPAGNASLYAPQARDRFPSNINQSSSKYIHYRWDTDYGTVNALSGAMLSKLKTLSVPKISYEVKGFYELNIGDTVVIEDAEYNPTLYLSARVVEQEISFTDPAKNKTTFDNFTEMISQIDDSLTQLMNRLIAENKVYDCTITSDNGIVFKNGIGETTLTAQVWDGTSDATAAFDIVWTVDGTEAAQGDTLTISADEVTEKAVVRFTAYDQSGNERGLAEVTVSDVNDGESGSPGPAGPDAVVTVYIDSYNQEFGQVWLHVVLRVDGVITTPTSYKWTKDNSETVIGTSASIGVDDLAAVYNCEVTW